jgi:hypothetical protein
LKGRIVEKFLQIQQLLLRSRRLPWILVVVVLAILAGTILLTMQQTRARIRAQIAGRDGEVLHAVARMQMPAATDPEDPAGSVEDPANQLAVLLETSRLSWVLGARLFDPQGGFVESFPGDMFEAEVSAADLEILRSLQPVSRFHPAARLADVFLTDPETPPGGRSTVPLLEVTVPLHTVKDRRLVGIAQFIIEGDSIAREFARLDHYLLRQAMTAFVPAAIIMVAAIMWAFRRLNRAHRLLAERTETLVQANQELALAAKTSAVGAVTSHLIHGLKNPLAGLQNFVAGLGAAVADRPEGDLQQAIAATRRMQAMINDVVAVLREEEGSGHYQMSAAELVGVISGRMQGLCRERGVELVVDSQSHTMLPNRAANLVALILANLVQNAIEASPRNRSVRLAIENDGGTLRCERPARLRNSSTLSNWAESLASSFMIG